jgi:hypothetical protein
MVEMVGHKAYRHRITKPKSMRAVMMRSVKLSDVDDAWLWLCR